MTSREGAADAYFRWAVIQVSLPSHEDDGWDLLSVDDRAVLDEYGTDAEHHDCITLIDPWSAHVGALRVIHHRVDPTTEQSSFAEWVDQMKKLRRVGIGGPLVIHDYEHCDALPVE